MKNEAYRKLKKYQRSVVHAVSGKFRWKALLALDMGLGKTAISLACIGRQKGNAVVFCPAALKYNWAGEIEKFCPGIPYYICNGTRPVLPAPAERRIIICNYEIATYWSKMLADLRPSIIVCDESHYVKERDAKRTKAVLYVSRFCTRKLLLTGTPIENKPVELWSQLAILDPSMFPSWLLFAKRYNGAYKDLWGWRMSSATHADELNRILTGKCMVRLRKEDVLKELPPLTRHVYLLDPDNQKEYAEAKANIALWVRQNCGSEEAMRARRAEAQVRFDKLKLLAAQGKMAQIINWVNSNSPNFKIVLFCYHRSIFFELKSKIDNVISISQETPAKERQQAVDRFQNDSSIRVFLTSIRIGGTGLTLTAANTTVFAQLDWNASKHRQAEARVHRIGQEAGHIDAIYFIARNTVEERIMRLIDGKEDDASKVVDGREVNRADMLQNLVREML